jgi:HAD superfamily hydrolase (TIGR01458 family)
MFKGVLLDLGGVVFTGDVPLPGAVDAIARLRDAGLKLRFVTNITRQAHVTVVTSLQAIGVDVQPEEVFTPAFAAREYCIREGLTPHLLVHPALETDFAGLSGSTPDVVVIGDAGEEFSYAAMNRAFRLLSEGARFLALASNRAFRDNDGELSLDAGPFVAALEYGIGRQALVLGNPAKDFFLAPVNSMGIAVDAAVMVGDDAEFDVAAARAAGLSGVLVRSGKYRPGDEATQFLRPDHCAANLVTAVDWILARRESLDGGGP